MRLVAGGRTIAYDLLVVAVGGRHVPAYRRALTFAGGREMDFHGLLQDIDEGYSRAVDFVVPPGTTWTLPLYELALLTAREAWTMGIDDVKLRIVTPEAEPLGTVTVSQLRGYAAEGHFASGSMGPKVDAACRFVERGGARAVITDLAHITQAVTGDGGTVVVPD